MNGLEDKETEIKINRLFIGIFLFGFHAIVWLAMTWFAVNTGILGLRFFPATIGLMLLYSALLFSPVIVVICLGYAIVFFVRKIQLKVHFFK